MIKIVKFMQTFLLRRAIIIGVNPPILIDLLHPKKYLLQIAVFMAAFFIPLVLL